MLAALEICVAFPCRAQDISAPPVEIRDVPPPTDTPPAEQGSASEDAGDSENIFRPRFTVAVLQGLNKITTKTSLIKAPTGTAVRFGNIEIVARSCWKAPPEEKPEVAVLLDIWELKPDEPPARIFLGWMFASSPAISALEHPVYDITVKDCLLRPITEP